MSAGDDLFTAMATFVEGGHSFVFAPFAPKNVNPDGVVQCSISGPTGSRTVYGATPAAALETIIVALVSARLAGQ